MKLLIKSEYNYEMLQIGFWKMRERTKRVLVACCLAVCFVFMFCGFYRFVEGEVINACILVLLQINSREQQVLIFYFGS
jgi:hypothetical protein